MLMDKILLNNKRILAVVPARGGSKGIPRKNLKILAGKPLIALVGDVIRELDYIDRAVISTDDDEMAEVAISAGIDAPFRRPPKLSGDRIGDLDVLTHALLTTEEADATTYDLIIMLQPTSPLRKPEDVTGCVKKLLNEGWDAVWSVSLTDSKAHPIKQLKIDVSDSIDYYDGSGKEIIARQQLSSLFHRNGVAYAFTRECLLGQQTLKGHRTGAYVISTQQISIDTEWDIALAEYVLSSPP